MTRYATAQAVGSAAQKDIRNAFFNSHHEYFAVLDLQGVFVDENPAFFELLSDTAEPTAGRTFDAVMGPHGLAPWAEVEAGIARDGEYQRQDWYQSANGDRVQLLQFRLRPILEPDGSVIGYSMTGIDLSLQAREHTNLERLAVQDALTGLYNRRFVVEKVTELVASGEEFAILVLDLDEFKAINDSMGHAAGDQLLRHVSNTMTEVVPLGETVGRIGGDEFIIIIEDFFGQQAVFNLAEELRLAIAQPIFAGNRTVRISASIGVSVFPEHGKDYETLLDHADNAMFTSKRKGKNAVSFMCESVAPFQHHIQKPDLLKDLFVAVNEDQFEPYFQCITDLETGQFTGVEMLCRWAHPKRGVLRPAAFIPVAEYNGLIVDIDRLMLRKACRFLGQLIARGIEPFIVFANVSAATVGQIEFVSFLKALLTEYGIPKDLIGLELTESMALLDCEHGRDCLTQLDKYGIPIALDDFGTGFSSLSLLKDLPVSRLKLDRSFVQNIDRVERDQGLLKAIISLGHALGTDIVAEGIETQAQHAALLGMGQIQGQGHLFCSPMPQDQLLDFLATKSPHNITR